ncbi:glycerate kinase [Flexithrix dorotheae]|uniref:glycerate kinase n=1 Tax=Flexithrix dorotheae TaxID=70993 RepID=UPI000371545E|nr:glycerate kinase [Flexithrix dorotheae]
MNRKLKVIIAPNSFKGSLDAHKAANAIEAGLLKASSDFETVKLPIADGGDHFADVLVKALGGQMKLVEVSGPLGNKVQAAYGITPSGTAIIEMAKASGLALLKTEELDALNATSFGTGELMKAAINEGCKEIILGIGGSATTDAGVGILQALGFSFLDNDGREIPFGGGNLQKINKIDDDNVSRDVRDCKIKIACDVENKIIGESGSARVFGPQKGASPEQVSMLEQNLKHFVEVSKAFTGKDLASIDHGGAAGGISAGLKGYLDAEICNGIDLVMEILEFEKHLPTADIVITAEGKLDFQTLDGKGPYGIALKAKEAGKMVIAFSGNIPPEEQEKFKAFDALFAIEDSPMSLEKAMKEGERLLRNSAFQAGSLIMTSSKLGF